MVLKKRLDNGSIGFQVSTVPRAPRSARRSAPHKKTESDKHVCAIELLASLAGKLLQETESSASNHASEDNDQLAHFKDVLALKMLAEDKPLKVEGQGSCEESAFVSEHSEESKQKDPSKRSPEVDSDNLWECNSIFPGSPCSDKENSDAKSIISNSETQLETSDKVESFPKIEVSDSERQLSADHGGTGANIVANSSSLEDSAEKSVKVPTALGSDLQAQKLFCKVPSHKPFSTWQKGDAKSGSRDDDEKFPRFNKYSTKFKPYRRPQRALDRRIRKLLTSKHWKAAPQLKDYESPKIDGGRKPFNQKRKMSYNREKYHRDFLYKRRKMLDESSMMTSDGVLSSESDTSSDYKNMNGDVGGSFAKMHGESGVPPSVLGNQASFGAKNSHVKFSIKSFKIPELFVDVPETATVGSLKRTIVEAVTAILGGGLRVGVLLRGKKIRDDNRTLLQTGLSCKDNLDSLGFMLEPNLTQAPPIKASEDVPSVSSGDAPKILTRSTDPVSDTLISHSLSDPANITNMVNNVDKNHDLIPLHADILTDKPLSDSRALVPITIPDTHPEPLAIVPVSQKSKRSELSQRRIRRPFSVSEVEALVQAVEGLGTGRWRDVKLRAFENADHRTYVDLKDKWKTLVHTASISPQQRRGEPVPQELLDRVLAAHSYWSQHQAKQHGKLQAGTLKIADVPAHTIEVEGN